MRRLNAADLLLRLSLAGVFLYASADKLLHPQDFASVVRDYRLLPDALVNPTAVVLPWLELVLGVLLLVGRLREGTLLLVNVLLPAFWCALAVNFFRGVDVDCGCFSTAPAEPSAMPWYMARDGFFVVLGVAAAWTHLARLRLTDRRTGAPGPARSSASAPGARRRG
jgi:uncharacterized membrane protein YphA (DoxX/SURF4 family)